MVQFYFFSLLLVVTTRDVDRKCGCCVGNDSEAVGEDEESFVFHVESGLLDFGY